MTLSSDDPHAATVESGSERAEPELLDAGARVGRYVIERKLGMGAMGVVYVARDPDLDRRVAVKVLRTGVPTAHARLLREGQALAKLRHPSVVTVYDVGRDRGGVVIAMELVEGTTLRGWLEDAPRSWRDALDKMTAAGRGATLMTETGDDIRSLAVGPDDTAYVGILRFDMTMLLGVDL